MAGIYIHIPFCKQACYYCDFHFSTNQQFVQEMINAICYELELRQAYLPDRKIQSIYFGGGTPSLLLSDQLNQILTKIASLFSVSTTAEITLEANPDDLTVERLVSFKSLGINRLSIGVQTFNTGLLKKLNRAHDREAAQLSYQYARDAGFTNISLDLMFALPDQSIEQLLEDIQTMVKLRPEHISCYSLTIEPQTAFGKWSATGKMKPVDDAVAAEQFETIMAQLANAGYDQYEISNFGKPGFYSKHNSSYWKRESYLGVGPSAHSFDGVSRQFNVSNNAIYVKKIMLAEVPYEREVLTREDQINEYIMTSLRTSWGCDLTFLQNTFSFDLMLHQKKYIQSLIDMKLIELDKQVMRLTIKGKLIADKIAADLFITP